MHARSTHRIGPFSAGVIATAAYWPGITGAAINTVWVAMALALPPILLAQWTRHAPRYPVALGVVALILIACVLAAPMAGKEAAWHYTVGALAIFAAFGLSRSEIRSTLHGAALGLAPSLIVSVFHLAGLPLVDAQHSPVPAGLFVNSMMLGVIAGLLFVAWVEFDLPPICGVISGTCIVMSDARLGALVAGVGGAIWLLRNTPRLFLIFGPLMAGAFVALWSYRPETIYIRLSVWEAALTQLVLFGHGPGAPIPFLGQSIDNANSSALQLAWDFGIMAIPLIGAMFYASIKRPSPFLVACTVGAVVCELFQQPSALCLYALALASTFRMGHGDGVTGILGRSGVAARLSDTQPEADRVGGGPVSVQCSNT